MAARNMQRIEINTHEKELCVKLVIYKDYTEMHGQQNVIVIQGVQNTTLLKKGVSADLAQACWLLCSQRYKLKTIYMRIK
jgi:hypothetical protein